MDIHNDEPTQQDELGRDAYVNALTEVATTCETPLVIGIYGRWGSGKTTLLRLIHDRIAQYDNSRVVWFDAWQHQFDDHPALALVHTISDQLGIKTSVKKILYALARGLSGWALKATTALPLTDVHQALQAYEEQSFLVREASIQLRKHFEELIAKVQDGRNGPSQRIIVFIDDLDRCLLENILGVLEALKLYLNVCGCVYFLGVDRKALERSIEYHYKDVKIDEVSYLDKIVQLPFSIPPMEPQFAISYIQSCLSTGFKSVSGPQVEKCVDLLHKGLARNPRTIKRFINTLMLNFALAKETIQHPRLDVLVALLLVQYSNPEFYGKFANQPLLVKALTGEIDSDELDNDLKRDVEELKMIMSNVTLPSIDEISKYIYLTRLRLTSVSETDFYFRYDHKGFYTEIGLKKLLHEEKEIGDNERILDCLLLFDTPQQHTWLVTTQKRLICILDDEQTRRLRTVVQWKMDVNRIRPESIKAYKSGTGRNVVELGHQYPWLYSMDLHPTPEKLEKAIRQMIEDAINWENVT